MYLEIEYAVGLKVPTIWTYKKGYRFSFDTAQFTHIVWKDCEELGRKVKNRIATILYCNER